MTALPLTPEDWLKLREDLQAALPEIIEKVGLPEVLLAYQQRTVSLLDTAGVSVLIIEKSRRIGETWALAAAAVLRASRGRAHKGMDAIYISYTQEIAREFIDACAMWAKAFSLAAGEVGETVFEDGEQGGDTRSIKAFRIQFASGFEVLGLSSAPRSLRGKQGLVIIDEAAFVDNLAELMKAALALLMWGGQVVVCSTHNGVDNPFNTLVQDTLAGRKPYTHIRIDFDMALSDGLYRRICLVQGKDWSPEAEAAWRSEIVGFYGDGADEELFCVPAMGSGAWLSGPLIESRMTGDCPILRFALPPDFLQRPEAERKARLSEFMEQVKRAVDGLDPERQHALGFDFGRVTDLSVLPVLEIGKTLTRRLALCIEMRGLPYDEQKVIVEYVLRHMPRPVGAAFDAVGSGEYIAEAMQRLFGAAAKEPGEPGGLVAAIKITKEWYRENMPPLKAAFDDGSIVLMRDDEHLGDLRLVKVIRGIPQIPAERTGAKGLKRHGDFAVGLALAYCASRMRYAEFGYAGVARGWTGTGPGRGKGFDYPDHSGDRGGAGGRPWWTPPLGSGLRGGV